MTMPTRTPVAIVAFLTLAVTHTLRAEDPFRVKPLDAFAVLADLEKSSGRKASVSPDEMKLFADAADGKLDEHSFAEALLIASGVTDTGKRRGYLEKLDALTAKARRELEGAGSDAERGERLLKFLHAKAMAAGYRSAQSSVAVVLDEGHFNCVSSAAVYNVVGRRLGWDLRAVEIPGHVYSVLYAGGGAIDVETTNKLGFNPKGDAASIEALKKPDGTGYVPRGKAKEWREVGELGLAAIIYANRSADLAKEKRYQESILAGFGALCLDRSSPTAVKNALAGLVNWGPELAKQGKFEEAVNVLAVGLRLAPGHDALRNNARAVWGDYARVTFEAGRDDEALAVVKRAAAALSDKDFADMPARLYIRRGEKLAEAGKWPEAIALAKGGLKKIAGWPDRKLRRWHADLYLRRAQRHEKAGDYDKALAALEDGIADLPADPRYPRQVAYLSREWVKAAGARDPAGVPALVKRLRERFPENKGVREVGAGYAREVLRKRLDAGEWEKALEELRGLESVLASADEARDLGVMVYDEWARSHADKKAFEEAVGVYARGLAAYPKNSRLTQNLVAAVDSWAWAFIDAKEWDKAIAVYEKALKMDALRGNAHLTNNLRYCRERKKAGS